MSLDAFKQEYLDSTEPWSDEPKIRHQRLWHGTVHLDADDDRALRRAAVMT